MAATAEQIVLDPAEGISGRSAFEITDWIDHEGADWGTAAIDAIMAEGDRGAVPVDFTVPNREVTIPLKGVPRGGTTWTNALESFQAKVALFQKEGGVLKRTSNAGGVVYADIVDASLTATSVSGWESSEDLDLDASLSLTTLPDFYEAEITLSDHVESSAAELVFTETGIDGDYPARVRMVVDNDQATDQKGLLWGYRCRHYSSATTAATKYEAEALNVLGTAVATTGASNGTAVRLSPLFPTWTSLLGTNLAGTQWMTHTGTNRVWARCYVQGTVQSQVRLSYDTADLVNAVVNDPYTLPSPGPGGTTVGSAFFLADLGEVRLDAAPMGTHRWQGQVDAQTYNTASGTADFRIDRVWVINQDEGAGVLTASPVESTGQSTLTAYDTFSGTAALTSTVAPLGGTWTVGAAGASTAEDGDTDDFTNQSSFTFRAPGADSTTSNGRYVALNGSSTISTCSVQADVQLSRLTGAGQILGGVLARFVDTDNWCLAVLANTLSVSAGAESSMSAALVLFKRVAGVVTPLGFYLIYTNSQTTLNWTLKLVVDSAGNASVYAAHAGAPLGAAKITKLADTDLDSGAIDDGRVGIYSASTVATMFQVIRNFKVYTPAFTTQSSDAVAYASQSAQLTTNGMYREDVGGTAYGPVSTVAGDLPRLPVAGLEGRTTEIFLKPTRSDLNGAAQLPDAGIDDLSCQVIYQPCWLHLPET